MDHSSISHDGVGCSCSNNVTDKVKDIYITPRKHQDITTRIALEAARDPYAIISPGKKQEINLLVDFLEYPKYPLNNASDIKSTKRLISCFFPGLMIAYGSLAVSKAIRVAVS
nr:hypothetical protein [Tanacetum cinerariifolium]